MDSVRTEVLDFYSNLVIQSLCPTYITIVSAGCFPFILPKYLRFMPCQLIVLGVGTLWLKLFFNFLNWFLGHAFTWFFPPECVQSNLVQILLLASKMQGTKVVDESHDQDSTDLHKCVAYIRDLTPNLDKSNVR
jgi:hypothetical protein